MKKIVIIIFLAFFGCTKDDTPQTSSVTFLIEGSGTFDEIKISDNNDDDLDPRSVQIISFKRGDLPFRYSIDEYHPNWMEIEVSLGIYHTSGSRIESIHFIKDGEVQYEDLNIDENRTGYRAYSEWGVYLND